jgi:hypothetical protein
MRYGGIYVGIVLALCVLTGGGCGKKAGSQMDAGRFEGSVYHNDYLGLTIALPGNWSIEDPQLVKQTARTGGQMLAGNSENLQAVLKEGEQGTVQLFNAFKYLPGSPVADNPYIYACAQDVSRSPGVQTGGDYLFHARRFLEAGQLKFTFPREVYTEKLGGQEFQVMTAELVIPPAGKMSQEHFATVRKGYAVVFTLSFWTEEERTELRSILNTLTLAPLAKP